MRIKAELIKCKDLKPGDLFSIRGQDYWGVPSQTAVGEKVYMRTEVPCPIGQAEEDIYLITIDR
jgi:hypothetical protein